MCAIFGAVLADVNTPHALEKVNLIMGYIINRSVERGRDGLGWESFLDGEADSRKYPGQEVASQVVHPVSPFIRLFRTGILVGNTRAEPTTEWVPVKKRSDQQPYTANGWTIVHNGTIANDKELRTYKIRTKVDSAAIPEAMEGHPEYETPFDMFEGGVKKLKGSFAILGMHNLSNEIFFAANYRPIWYIETEYGLFFASCRDYFPVGYVPQMIRPYSYGRTGFTTKDRRRGVMQWFPLPREDNARALVVCSGGLDSVVSAVFAQKMMHREIELIHFCYGSRAEGPEVKAVQAVGERLGCKVTVFPLPVYKPGDSPLLDHNSKVAGGEEGAEFAHEWVPARNLLLLSVATAYAEANGFSTLVLGNNLEEAGAYPDNEPEFIKRFNDLLPFAVGANKTLRVVMPVGNMMKHEIVKLGVELGAPLDLTWSCYRAGSQHCGTCGPCYMRRKAFEINNLPEVISYEA